MSKTAELVLVVAVIRMATAPNVVWAQAQAGESVFAELKGNEIRFVRYCRKDSQIICGDAFGVIRLLDARTGEFRSRPCDAKDGALGRETRLMRVLDDGRQVLIPNTLERGVELWNADDNTRRHLIGCDVPLEDIQVFGDDRFAIVKPVMGSVSILDLKKGEVSQRFKNSPQWSMTDRLAVLKDGGTILGAESNGPLRMFDGQSGACRGEFDDEWRDNRVLGLSENEEYVAAGQGHGAVIIWDRKRRTILHTLKSEGDDVVALEFCGQPPWGIVAGCSDGTIVVWGLSKPGILAQWNSRHGAIRAIDVSSEGDRLVSAGSDGAVRTWRLPTREVPVRHSKSLQP